MEYVSLSSPTVYATLENIQNRKCWHFGVWPANHTRKEKAHQTFSTTYVQSYHAANTRGPKYIGVHFPGPADGDSQARKHEAEDLEWSKWKVSKT